MERTRLTTRSGQAVRHASRRTVGVLLGLAAVVAASACTPEPGPTPTPSPTFTCTASVGACTPKQAEKEAKAAKDHAAAEEAVKAGNDEFYRLHTVRNAQVSAELRKYVAGSELTGAARSLKQLHDRRRIAVGRVITIYARSTTQYPAETQTIEMCIDSTAFYTTDLAGDDASKPAGYLRGTVDMTLIDGAWKRTGSGDPVKVDTCEE